MTVHDQPREWWSCRWRAMIIVLLNATDSCKSNRHLVTAGYCVFLRLRTRGKRDPKGKRMEPYIELKPVMTIKAKALVAP